MQFVADENIAESIVTVLRELQLDVLSISELMPGCPDSEVLSFANKNNSIIITSDKDFGEIIFRQLHSHRNEILISHIVIIEILILLKNIF